MMHKYLTRRSSLFILVHGLNGASYMVGQTYPVVIKTRVNIGKSPFPQKINDQGIRSVQYHHDHYRQRWPRFYDSNE